MTTLALVLALGQVAAPAGAPERPAITIHSVKAEGVQVFHLNMPWGPETFAAMERPGEGFYNRRSWPFARMETTKALEIGDHVLPAGNYALVFHPNTPSNEGMSLEVRKIAPGEFLQSGNVMTRTPEGETVWRAPVTFEVGETTVPSLEIGLTPGTGDVRLDVRYGDRRMHRVFHEP
jgi:hypothetical protein